MYAIVKVGGKQYRVEKGDSLLVDRMPDEEGATVRLKPLLLAPGGKDEAVFGSDALAKVKVEAKVTGHLRGPKIHVLKFKPKQGYKRRQGHRSELTRLEIGDIELLGGKASGSKKSKAAAPKAGKPKAAEAKTDEPRSKAKPAEPRSKAKPAEPKSEDTGPDPKKNQGDKLEEAVSAEAKPQEKPAASKEKPASQEPSAPQKEEEGSDGS